MASSKDLGLKRSRIVRGTAFAAVASSTAVLFLSPAAAQREPVQYSLPEVKYPLPLETNAEGVYGLEHTHVITGDIEKSIHFYVDLLGFTQITPVRDLGVDEPMNEMLGFGGKASFRQAMLAMPGGASYGKHVPGIEIWEVTGVPLDKTLINTPAANLQGKGYNAYRVKDLAGLLKKLEAAGVKTVSKQVFLSPEVSGIYAVDPDGQIVELDQFPKPFGEE